MKLRREDMVVVRSGNFRGQGPAKVVSIDRDVNRAIVEGINSALKHVKRGHPKSPQGGRVTIPVSIDISNLSLYCPSCNRGVRVKTQVVEGSKRRVCVRCQKSL